MECAFEYGFTCVIKIQVVELLTQNLLKILWF